MTPFTTFLQRTAALLLLLVLLNGCTFGARRLRDNPNSSTLPTAAAATLPATTGPVDRLSSPAAPGEPVQPTHTGSTAAAPTATVKAASASAADPSGQDLLNQISTLDAANQAGDRLDDLPQ